MTKPRPRFLSSRLKQIFTLTALSIGSSWAAATVSTFTGGDSGEGLDLQGNFTFAVNVGPSGAAGRIGDANFTADNVPGVTVEAGNNIGNGGWLAANYGDTTNDNNLEFLMNSIRWSDSVGAPPAVTIRLRVETGIEYKLQLLFGEDCCIGRGFNVLINNTTEAMNLMPGVIQADVGDFVTQKEIVGVVLTHTFTAPSNELVIVLDGNAADSPDIIDRNATINGFSLERISPVTDSDGDGLRDDWETGFFGNLVQTGSGDFDSDGLTNLEENTRQTDPTDTDTDNDGLLDGAEVTTHQTDPGKNDSDGDGLRDGDEVNVYQTNAAQRDTDSDTFSDYDEVRLFSDPKSAPSVPRNTTIGLFTGGNAGEGLDLQGTFPYALDNAAEGVAGGQAGDALFTPEGAEGTAVITGNKTLIWNAGILYGDTPEDLVLADVMNSISWSDWNARIPNVRLNFSNLVVGATYKMQLLFAEQAWPRGFDVAINGARVADDFAPVFYQGGGFPLAYPDNRGVVLTHTFVARANNVDAYLDGRGTTTPEFTDHNAIINAVTLELVSSPADTDSDSLPDAWEITYFGNLAQTGTQDPDNDTLSNATEFADGTNPNAADSDSDGLTDSQEKTSGTASYLSDSDFDGLTDGAEVNTHQTNPLSIDTESDGVLDGAEIAQGRNPKVSEAKVLVRSFTGGDAGEGLDLDGTFLYAFSVGTENSAGQARDVLFTGQTVDGVTILQAPSPIETYHSAAYGDTPNDDVLELAMQSIRHGGGGARIIFSNLVAGSEYKVQLLFGENGSPRGFDVLVDGKLIVDDFAPFMVMGGVNETAKGALVSYSFIAKTNVVEVQTTGAVSNPRYSDRNPIINAVTLEQVAANTDGDGDGLSDPWENFNFGNLTQTATSDPDSDGLDNRGELQFGTDPSVADADADGLNDSAERTAGTNPAIADTDGDTLSDGAEVNTHHSSPVSADGDRDGRPDPAEIAQGSNPTVADTGTLITAVTGGDAGEGLDLDGTFVYAFSVMPDTAAIGQVRDAVFTSENVEGVTVASATAQAPNWYVPEFGSTPNDDALELIIQNIRHSGGGARITLSNLVAGTRYKVQLIFGEACCNRGMDILVDGNLIADEFAPYEIQGFINNPAQAAAVAYEFTASTNTVLIQTTGGTVTTARYTDRNPIINAVTLENIGTAPVLPRIRTISRQGGFAVTFDSVSGRSYTLQYKARLSDVNWTDGATVSATGATATLTDADAAHQTGASGFWRIKTQ
jgi:hypothetical protein